MAIRLGNIGIIYSNQGGYPKALKHYFEALEIDKELGRKNGIAANFSNIGNVYSHQGNYPKALKHYFEALEIMNELGNISYIAITLGNIGSLYTKQKKYKESEEYLLRALEAHGAIGFLEGVKNWNEDLSTLYTQTQNYPLALKHYKQYTTAKDSLFNEEKSKDIGRLEQTHELELAEIQRKKQEAEQARLIAEQTQRRNQLQYSGIVLVLVGLFIGIFLFARRFRKIKEYKTFRQYTKIVEAALFISFLIFFEFILVVLDPYIEQITGGAPLWKLGFNALLAGIIFPIHSLLENKLKGQVIKTERKKWVAEAVKGKNLLVIIGLGLVFGLNSGFDASTPLSTGSSKVDSLKKIIATAEHDTTKVNALRQWDNLIYISDPELDLELNQSILEICEVNLTNELKDSEKRFYGYKLAHSYNNIGIIYANQSDYPLALNYYFKSLKIRKELGDKQGMADSYNNIGIIYKNQSSYPQAMDYYFKSLKIYEEQSNKEGIALTYNNIGNIYNSQSSYPLALTYYFKSLKIHEEMGNKPYIASCYDNICILYTALYVQGDSLGRAGDWAVENPTKLLDTALYYQQKALVILKELSDENGMTYNLYCIATILMQKETYIYALEYYQQCVMLADSIGALHRGSLAHSGLSVCYEKLNNHKLALEHYKQYSTLKDSVFNEEKSKDLGKLEAKHEFEMAELQKKQQEEEWTMVETARVTRRNDLQHSAILIGIFILFGSLFLLGKLSIPNWLVELSVFIPFLILFEFLLVLLDPRIESWAGSEPAFKLLFNAGLASLMFPLHQFFEGKLKKRIVKAQRLKLKKRMEQFKRDVEEL